MRRRSFVSSICAAVGLESLGCRPTGRVSTPAAQDVTLLIPAIEVTPLANGATVSCVEVATDSAVLGITIKASALDDAGRVPGATAKCLFCIGAAVEAAVVSYGGGVQWYVLDDGLVLLVESHAGMFPSVVDSVLTVLERRSFSSPWVERSLVWRRERAGYRLANESYLAEEYVRFGTFPEGHMYRTSPALRAATSVAPVQYLERSVDELVVGGKIGVALIGQHCASMRASVVARVGSLSNGGEPGAPPCGGDVRPLARGVGDRRSPTSSIRDLGGEAGDPACTWRFHQAGYRS